MAAAATTMTEAWEGGDGVDWEGGETPRAARDVPPRTVLFATSPVACVSTMMLPRGHAARKYYPQNTRFLDPTRDSGAWNPNRELVGALNDAGLTDAELVKRFPVSRVKRRGGTPVDFAVLDNELHMIDPWTGNQYGTAMVEKYVGVPHACRPNCTLTFGLEGMAYLVSGEAPIAAGTSLTISKISHQHGATLCVCMRMSLIGSMTKGGGEDGGCVCTACVETAPAAPMAAGAAAAAAAPRPQAKGPGAHKHRGRGKGRGAKAKTAAAAAGAAVATPKSKPTARECDPETCSMATARAHNVASPMHAKTVYDPTDFMSYLTQSKGAMAALVAAWTANGARIARAPYALSRFALKLSLLGGEDSDGCNMAEVRTMYEELAAAIVADTEANGGVPRVLTPAGVIALAAPPPVMEAYADGYAAAVRRVTAAANDVLATHPWMGVDEVHNFSPWMCARSPTAAHHIAMLHRAGIEGKTVDVNDLEPAGGGGAFTAAARIAADAAASPPAVDTRVCAVCSRETRKTCSRCGVWRYCSPECQREHWPLHKVMECRPTLSDKVPAKLDMHTALSAWMAWPLRETALRNYPRSGADVISSLIDRAGARAAANAGTEEDPGDVAARRHSAANGAAMLRFMNANCEAEGCGTSDRSNLRACTKCALVFYCSDAHAKDHWKEHRVVCGLPDVSATDSAGNARHFFGTPSARS